MHPVEVVVYYELSVNAMTADDVQGRMNNADTADGIRNVLNEQLRERKPSVLGGDQVTGEVRGGPLALRETGALDKIAGTRIISGRLLL